VSLFRTDVPIGAVISRVREDYPILCDRCGSPHWFDTSIPSDIWNVAVAGRWGTLCLLCVDEVIEAAGMTCEAEIYFTGRAVKSKLYRK